MNNLTYTDLINNTLDLYLKGEYQKAYDYITENAEKVEGIRAQIYNFRYATACKAGLIDLALSIFKEAVLDKGYWYSYEYLIEDDDLEPLHQFDEFNRLVELCKEREIEAKEESQPRLEVLQPERSNKQERVSTVIALHGNQENMEITKGHWSPLVDDKFLLALPQSSQIEFSDSYSWNDFQKGAEELSKHYQRLLEEYNVDNNNIILGGFSAGARTSLYAVIQGMVSTKGLIFVGPLLPEIEKWEEHLDQLKSENIKTYVICGDQDEDSFESSTRFIEMLNKRGLPNRFRVVEGLDHNYPADFSKFLKDAVSYIMADK